MNNWKKLNYIISMILNSNQNIYMYFNVNASIINNEFINDFINNSTDFIKDQNYFGTKMIDIYNLSFDNGHQSHRGIDTGVAPIIPDTYNYINRNNNIPVNRIAMHTRNYDMDNYSSLEPGRESLRTPKYEDLMQEVLDTVDDSINDKMQIDYLDVPYYGQVKENDIPLLNTNW